MTEVSVDRLIKAAPESLYRLVSDVTRMSDWSPETTSCRWLGGASGPAVGARFRGANRANGRRWSTTCTVVSADEGRRFAFDVAAGPFPVARWTYEFAPEDGGCRVTERWQDRRQRWMQVLSSPVTGVRDRSAHNRVTMLATLENLPRFAESTSD
ncbi:MAG TPA: SRPBCC family protein [Acidimicrobiales bacterium]|nr:SRPBCC family protein [Acidimicrobiales bacterium]